MIWMTINDKRHPKSFFFLLDDMTDTQDKDTSTTHPHDAHTQDMCDNERKDDFLMIGVYVATLYMC